MTNYVNKKKVGRPKGAGKPCRFECRVSKHFKNQLAYLRQVENSVYSGKSDSYIIEEIVTIATLQAELYNGAAPFKHYIDYSPKNVSNDNTQNTPRTRS